MELTTSGSTMWACLKKANMLLSSGPPGSPGDYYFNCFSYFPMCRKKQQQLLLNWKFCRFSQQWGNFFSSKLFSINKKIKICKGGKNKNFPYRLLISFYYVCRCRKLSLPVKTVLWKSCWNFYCLYWEENFNASAKKYYAQLQKTSNFPHFFRFYLVNVFKEIQRYRYILTVMGKLLSF